jgi:DNA-directed RNA polymerase specialized sigma24 family protein
MDCEKNYIHELLVQLKYNNDEAVRPLMDCLSEVFYKRAVGRYQLSHEDAQDAIQQTFFRIIDGGIDKYVEEKRGGPGWMWRVFGHVVIDIIRQKPDRQGRVESLDEILEKVQSDILVLEASEEMTPVWSVEHEEITDAVQKTWDALSEADRKAIFRGRGPGTYGRKEYWMASKQARALFETFYGPIRQS